MAIRVLLCDDNADTVDSLAMLLDADGHDTHVCYSGLACIEKARHWQPHLVLVDIGLPDVSGHVVAREIRQMPVGRDVVLVAFTGRDDTEEARAAAGSGFNAHMTKGADPILLVELAARMRNAKP